MTVETVVYFGEEYQVTKVGCRQCGRELTIPPTKFGYKPHEDGTYTCEICFMTNWTNSREDEPTELDKTLLEILGVSTVFLIIGLIVMAFKG